MVLEIAVVGFVVFFSVVMMMLVLVRVRYLALLLPIAGRLDALDEKICCVVA